MITYKKIKYILISILILGILFVIGKIFIFPSTAKFIVSKDSNYLFQIKNVEAFEANFGQEQNMPDMVFKSGDSEIKITIPYENAKWEKTAKGLRAISNGIIFDYSIIKNKKQQSIGIKEEIILNQPTTYSSFTFPSFFKNLNPQFVDGVWKFYDNNWQEKFYIPKPFMIDANNNRSEDVEIEVSTDGKFIKIIPNAEWLKDKNRKYPIMIDPSFIVLDNSTDSELRACDYKDGEIILIKPVATGVGDDRLEAGDIVEIREGQKLCDRFGNGDFLGNREKTNLLVVYYPAKLTQQQKKEMTESEYDGNKKDGKIIKSRKMGVDYTKFLDDSETLKVRSFEKLRKIPEIDLSSVIQKSSEQKSVVGMSKHLARIENFRNEVKKIVRKIIPFVYAGTGGTKTICSSGCDYTSLNGWEGTEEGALSEPAIAQITGAFEDTTDVSISGWTTSAANYIYIYTTGSARHAGMWSEDKYHIVATNTSVIRVYEEYVRIDGLQIQITGTNDSQNSNGILAPGYGVASASDIRISNCVIRGILSSTGTGAGILTYESGNAYGTVRAWNNIIYDFVNGTVNCFGILALYNENTYLYNNTIENCYIGMAQSSSYTYPIANNNLISGSTVATTGTFANGTDYNVTDSASLAYTVTDGGNTHDHAGHTFTFTSATDFHLDADDVGAKDLGVSDPGSGLFSDDIDGETRSGTWDVGADEYVAAAPTLLKHTVKPSGQGGDFTTLAAAVDHLEASHANLVSANVYAEIEISGTWSSADTDPVSINGLTTDATHYLSIYTTGDARHAGTWSDTKYRLTVTNAYAIDQYEDYVTIDGLQMKLTVTSGGTYRAVLRRDISGVFTLSNNIMVGAISGADGEGRGFDSEGGTGVDKIYNNIIYGFINGDINSNEGISLESTNAYVYNNTIYNCYFGIRNEWGTTIAKNNISYNNTDNYSGSFDGSSTNNLSGPSPKNDAPGDNPQNAVTVSFVNVGAGTENLHLLSTDTGAKDLGVSDPGSGLFSDDIDGETRSGTWDVGADEYVVAAINKILNNKGGIINIKGGTINLK